MKGPRVLDRLRYIQTNWNYFLELFRDRRFTWNSYGWPLTRVSQLSLSIHSAPNQCLGSWIFKKNWRKKMLRVPGGGGGGIEESKFSGLLWHHGLNHQWRIQGGGRNRHVPPPPENWTNCVFFVCVWFFYFILSLIITGGGVEESKFSGLMWHHGLHLHVHAIPWKKILLMPLVSRVSHANISTAQIQCILQQFF